MDWDERFAAGHAPHHPSPPLAEAVSGVVPGVALDVACGAGRHALFLAGRGWQVHALDASRAGISRLEADADRLGVSHLVRTRIVDLESPDFTLEGAFDLICDFYFLH